MLAVFCDWSDSVLRGVQWVAIDGLVDLSQESQSLKS